MMMDCDNLSTMKKIRFNLKELDKVAKEIMEIASGRKKLLLFGEIGSGKTTFTQHFCRLLDVRESPSSPSFAIINEYSYLDRQTNIIRPVYHIDLYRLTRIEEALDIGIEDYLYDNEFCLIEWPELIEPLFPEKRVELYFGIVGNDIREIEILIN